jgi:hypothetical protein
MDGALLEGSALFLLIAYIQSHAAWLWGIVAVLLAMMLALIPTRQRIVDWVACQLELIELER